MKKVLIMALIMSANGFSMPQEQGDEAAIELTLEDLKLAWTEIYKKEIALKELDISEYDLKKENLVYTVKFIPKDTGALILRHPIVLDKIFKGATVLTEQLKSVFTVEELLNPEFSYQSEKSVVDEIFSGYTKYEVFLNVPEHAQKFVAGLMKELPKAIKTPEKLELGNIYAKKLLCKSLFEQ